ncbi:MAG: hypothetical protein ACHQ52_14960 [Candidatus Eisenbacteria bacterium]
MERGNGLDVGSGRIPDANDPGPFGTRFLGLVAPAIGRHLDPTRRPARRILTLLLIAWVPLVVLTALHGDLVGDHVRVTLLRDFTVWARFVIALPMFAIAEPAVNRAAIRMLDEFSRRNLVPPERRAKFEALLAGASRLRKSPVPEILTLLIVVALAVTGLQASPLGDATSWRWVAGATGHLRTPAARWCDWVSESVLVYWMMWMLWCLLAWTGLLARISLLGLRLIPTHPDRSGGLGFLGYGHARFAGILGPISVVLSAAMVSDIHYSGATLDSFKIPLGAYVVIGLLILLAPLLVFAPRLAKLREAGVLDYGALANEYVEAFDRKWVQRRADPGEPLLGSADIQSLADMGNSHEAVLRIRPVPVDTRNLVMIVAGLVLPMVPFLAFVVPLRVMLTQVLKLIH